MSNNVYVHNVLRDIQSHSLGLLLDSLNFDSRQQVTASATSKQSVSTITQFAST